MVYFIKKKVCTYDELYSITWITITIMIVFSFKVGLIEHIVVNSWCGDLAIYNLPIPRTVTFINLTFVHKLINYSVFDGFEYN